MPRDVGSHRGTSRVAAATSFCQIRRTREAVLRELARAVAALAEARTGNVANTPAVAHLAARRLRLPRSGSPQPEAPGLWEQLDTIEQLVTELETVASTRGRSGVDGAVFVDRLAAASQALERAGQALSRSRERGLFTASGEDQG